MIQVWTMMGLGGMRPDDDPIGPIMKLFDDAGYIGVVATNCEQTYHRYLQPGEDVSITAELGDVVRARPLLLGQPRPEARLRRVQLGLDLRPPRPRRNAVREARPGAPRGARRVAA